MYQRPEILEIGPAQRLTLGRMTGMCDDACECVKECDVDVGFDPAWPNQGQAPAPAGSS